jgi:hypothetical protein
MPHKKSLYPKCIVCDRKATRWDGGLCGVVITGDPPRMQPGYIAWLCKTHDPRHKSFDLPDTLPEAIGDLVYLREKLQEMFAKHFHATTSDGTLDQIKEALGAIKRAGDLDEIPNGVVRVLQRLPLATLDLFRDLIDAAYMKGKENGRTEAAITAAELESLE